LTDRERIQEPRHRDTELARHQLAHWHGRSERPQEAVRCYEAMRRSAERENRTKTALTLLREVGYWQHKSGDKAAALRAFSQMLQTTQQELGLGHQFVAIARQRYAEIAGVLPFGNEDRRCPRPVPLGGQLGYALVDFRLRRGGEHPPGTHPRTIASVREPDSVEPSEVTALSTGALSRPALRTRAYSVTITGSVGKARPPYALPWLIHKS
jgi:hypothetical protein